MRRIAFIFSGQGAQYPGMARALAEAIPECRRIFDTADAVLGRGIADLCFDGPQEELNLTRNTQPCVLAADLAALVAVRSLGIKPEAAAGFSLGEYAALTAAGVIGLEDAFRIIQLRADAMQRAVPVGEGAMAAVMKLSDEEVRSLCEEVGGYVVPANYNSTGQIVVSGETAAVDALTALCRERKIKALKLPVSAPFHCEMMKPAADALDALFEKYKFGDPAYPIYMNVDGAPESRAENFKAKASAQAKSPVYWERTLKNMAEAGIDTFIELGPGKTLTGFVKKTLPEALALHVEDMETLSEASEALKA